MCGSIFCTAKAKYWKEKALYEATVFTAKNFRKNWRPRPEQQVFRLGRIRGLLVAIGPAEFDLEGGSCTRFSMYPVFRKGLQASAARPSASAALTRRVLGTL